MRDDRNSGREGESEPSALGALDRREYMKAAGSVGLAGLLGTGAAGAAPTWESGWEDEADQRIEEHRKSGLEVVVEDENGDPVADADVSVEMQEHEFSFGTAIHAEFLTRGSEWGKDIHTEADRQRYREVAEEYFNTVVLENVHKWYLWETNQQIADDAVQWARERGMDVRGHVCLWGNVGAWAVPPRVVEAMGDPWASDWDEAGQPDPDPEFVRSESMSHIEEIIDYYGDDITEWEVVNEVFHEPSLIEAIEGEGVTPETAPILGDWYERAQEVADQYDVGIAVNDYNTLAGAYTGQWDRYEDQIDYLVNERGVDLDGVGMQSHHYAEERVDHDRMWDALERYSQYGAGLRITEFDMFGSGWDQQMQADYLRKFLKLFFSHPDAEQFLMWGFWDPLHWGDDLGEAPNAPLFDDDWTEKEAFEAYTGLVFDEWWTDESGTTDAQGVYATTAFLGEHEVTVETDSRRDTETVSLSTADGTTTVTVTLTPEDEADLTAPSAPESVEATADSHTAVYLSWSAASDEGGSGLAEYAISVDGRVRQTVPAGTTETTVESLGPETTYEFGVTAVDGDGNESPTVTASATTEGVPGPEESLVVHDFEGAYPGSNALGNWADGGSFQNDGGEVSDGVLRLEYDSGGWFGSQLSADVTAYDRLEFVMRGDSGGEGSDVQVNLGSTSALLSDLALDSVGTEFSAVRIPRSRLSGDLSSAGELRLDFWQGGSGAVEIDEIRFASGYEDGEESQTVPAPSGLSVIGRESAAVEVGWEFAADATVDRFAVSVDGQQVRTVPAGTTQTRIEGLESDRSYEVGVSAVAPDGTASDPATVTATTGTEDDGGDEPQLDPIDGNVPRDLDGDGHYKDINGNGRIESDDVVKYFNNYDQPVITDHVEAYDYNDSGEIDFDDIVTLFNEL